MNAISQLQKEELRGCLLPLAEACPVDDCNPEDCPLYLLRKMKYAQRLVWINGLNEEDLVHLATYHHVCMNAKLAARQTLGDEHC